MTQQTTLKCLDCGNTEDFHTTETQLFTVEPTIYKNSENEPTVDITDTDEFETTPITCDSCDSTNIKEPDGLQHNFA